MPWSSKHIKFLIDTKSILKSNDGKLIKLFEFDYNKINKKELSEWAKHFRNHYCFDSEIDKLVSGTGKTKTEFLNDLKFPSTTGFGPGLRSGDFGEILVADYLEYVLGHFVPRTRYGNKTIRDESTKGTDLIGFKLVGKSESIDDLMTLFEVKAQLSGSSANPRLQNAIDGSSKDELRKAESLNAIKQRLYDKNKDEDAKIVERFQNPIDKPFKEQYAAAAVFCSSVLDIKEIVKTDATNHTYYRNLMLVVIHGKDFMKLVHKLYETAANEA